MEFVRMPPDTEKLDAALRENMRKRKVQQQARKQALENAVPSQELLEPQPQPD